jgi:peroxiredoxin
MKKTLVLSLAAWAILTLVSSCKKSGTEAVSFEPSRPRAGSPVTITYKPAGTPLAEAQGVDLVAYTYTKGQPTAVLKSMTRTKEAWTAVFNPEAGSRGAVLKFVGGDIIDSNARKGYILPLYDLQGRLVAGSWAGLAQAYLEWGSDVASMDRDGVLALKLFEKEFAAHPEMKREYLSSYLRLVARQKKAAAQTVILDELNALAARTDLGKDDFSTLIYWYSRINRPSQARNFVSQLLALDPKGDLAQNERFGEFYQTQDLARKVDLAKSFKKEFPGSALTAQVDYAVIASLSAAGERAKAQAYLDLQADTVGSAAYNLLALDVSKNENNAAKAQGLADKAVALARRELDHPPEPKPSYLTDPEWKAQLSSSLGECLDTLGGILFRLGRKADSTKATEEAVARTEGKAPEVNEHYAISLAEAGSPQQVLAKVGPLISSGNGTTAMKDIVKAAYLKDRGSDTGLEAYLSGLEKAARDRLKAELRLQLIDNPAPAFVLNDLLGKVVSLSDLRGKVVILDFWATWCGPCKESFPGMKAFVEKYKANPEVEVLFIDSWERVKDKTKNAADFIAANGYPFHVLVDNKDEVIDAFQVDGVPTKFVIDKNGRIRFKSIGFMGRSDKLVDELETMVDLVR